MITSKPINDLEAIKEYLNYDPKNGLFTWLKSMKGPAKKGMIAGANHSGGYVVIGFNGKGYLAHRLAWAFVHGSIEPETQIDHINGNRKDNRIENLRACNHNDNCRNSKPRSHNKSGIKGVRKMRSKWAARIRVDNKEIWLGCYDTPEMAKEAYDRAAQKYHGAFARTK